MTKSFDLMEFNGLIGCLVCGSLKGQPCTTHPYHSSGMTPEWRKWRFANNLVPTYRTHSLLAMKSGVKFQIHCFFMKNGEVCSDWEFAAGSLEDAENYCIAQMAPSDTSLVIGYNFACNKTREAYVNCTISLLRKNGNWVEIEELIHPLHKMFLHPDRDEVDKEE